MPCMRMFTLLLVLSIAGMGLGGGFVSECQAQITTQDVQVPGEIRQCTDIQLCPDGSRAILPVWEYIPDSCYLSVLDMASGTILYNVRLPGNVLRVDVDAAITPDNTKAVVASVDRYSNTDFVSIVILATGASIDLNLPGRLVDGSSDIVLTSDGAKAVIPTQAVGTFQGYLTIVSVVGQSVLSDVLLPGQVFSMDMDAVIAPSDTLALIPSWAFGPVNQDWLSIVNLNTGVKTDVALPGKLTAGVDVVLTPDGSRALIPLQNYVPGSNGFLCIIDVAAGIILHTVPLPGNIVVDDIDVVVKPDGLRAVMPSTNLLGFTDFVSVIDVITGVTTDIVLPGRLTDGVDVVLTPDGALAVMPQRDIFSPQGHLTVIDIASPVPGILRDVLLPGNVVTPDVDVMLKPDGITALMPSSDIFQSKDLLSVVDIVTGAINSAILTGKLVYFVDVGYVPSGGTVFIPSADIFGWDDWVTIARNVPFDQALVPVRTFYTRSEEVSVVDLPTMGVTSFTLPGQVLDGIDVKGSSLVGDATVPDADFYVCRIATDSSFWWPQTPPALPPRRPPPPVPDPNPQPKIPPGPCNKPVSYPPEGEPEPEGGPTPSPGAENYRASGHHYHILKEVYVSEISCQQGKEGGPRWRPKPSEPWRELKVGQLLMHCAWVWVPDGCRLDFEKPTSVVTGEKNKGSTKSSRPDMYVEVIDGQCNLVQTGYLDPEEYCGDATPVAEAWIDTGVQPYDDYICAWVVHDSSTDKTLIACPTWSVGRICTRSTVVDTHIVRCIEPGQSIVYDSTGYRSFCGDGILEGDEECELGIPCPDADTCHLCLCWSLYGCGDCNGDTRVTIADATYLVAYIYRGGPSPLGQGDVNLDSRVTIADATYLVTYIYRGGPAPCEPSEARGQTLK